MEGRAVKPPASMIVVTCDDVAHLPKLSQVARIWRYGAGRWVELAPERGTMVFLDDHDQPTPSHGGPIDDDEESANRRRRHFNFKCKLCSAEVRARAKTLDPVFDTLAENSIESVSLQALAARLRST